MEEQIIYVFTPVKDGRNHIKKLFNSFLEQTYTNFTHLIFDNGSVDPIEDLVNEYKEEIKRRNLNIKVIYEFEPKKIGLNNATITCIKKVDLPYFIWINCDDFVDKNFFLESYRFIKKHPTNIIYRTKTIDVGPDLKELKNQTYKGAKKNYLYRKNQRINLFYGLPWGPTYFYVNTELYKNVNPDYFFLGNSDWNNDAQVFITGLISNYNWNYISKAISYYVNNSESYFHSQKFLGHKDEDFELLISNQNCYIEKQKMLALYDGKKILNKFISSLESRNRILSKTNFKDLKYNLKINRIKFCKIPYFYKLYIKYFLTK